jgi:SAM-dependent methyltransferase
LAKFAARTPLHPQWLLGGNRATIDWIAGSAAGRVLDIGCADRWIEHRLPEGCAYIGLDYPATGRDLYAARPDVFADASRLPLADASVDTVLMVEVLEHLARPAEALREILRVLRPQDKVLVSIPFLYPIHDAPHDYQRLTRYGLFRDLEAAGFRVEGMHARLGCAESAGLIACLSLAGIALETLKRPGLGILLTPLLLAAIPIVNVLAWLGGMLLPSWDAVTNGYQLTASKP